MPLEAKAAVLCGQLYHIKIAVADVNDPAYDSGVFIDSGSFTSPNAPPALTVNAGNDEIVCEGDAVQLIGIASGGRLPYIYSWTTIAGPDTVHSKDSASTSLMVYIRFLLLIYVTP